MNESSGIDRVLKPVEVAERLGVKVGTVWAWCRSRKLIHIRISQRAFRIKESQLEEFLKNATR